MCGVCFCVSFGLPVFYYGQYSHGFRVITCLLAYCAVAAVKDLPTFQGQTHLEELLVDQITFESARASKNVL